MDDEYLDNPKPCPFCGSAPCVMVNGKWNYIHCDACGADGPADLGLSGAITGWNKRSGEDDLRRQLEQALEATEYALNNLDYLRKLWGDEGVTNGIADRLREVLKGGE